MVKAILILGVIIQAYSLTISSDASSLERSVFEAQAQYEAGDATAAQNLYELQLNDQLEPWKKGILNYNIGTVLLSQGKLNESKNYFEKADEGALDFPLLKMRLQTNISLGQFLLAKEGLENLNKNSSPSLEAYRNISLLIQEAEGVALVAEMFSCILAKVEGAPVCSPSLQQQRILEGVLELNEQLMKSYQPYYEKHFSMQKLKEVLELGQSTEFLDFLIDFYTALLVYNPLPKVDLEVLSHIQTNGFELFKNSKRDLYQRSLDYLAKGLNQEDWKSRVYLELARLELLKMGEINTPKQKLLLALNQEEIGLFLTKIVLNQYKSAVEKSGQDLYPLLASIQDGALLASKAFIEAALESQKSEANQFSIPWEEVIPLVISGQGDVEQARGLMNDAEGLNRSKGLQSAAIQKWRKALQLIIQGRSGNSEQDKLSSQSTEQINPNEQKLQGIVQRIQEMELDDQSDKLLKVGPSGEGDSRPW